LVLTLLWTVGTTEAGIVVSVDSVAGTTMEFGNVRVGTSASHDLDIHRTGPGNNSLNPLDWLAGVYSEATGEFSRSGGALFGPIVTNGYANHVSRTYTYTPTNVGFDSQVDSVLATQGFISNFNVPVTLQGTGVSPVFASSSVSPGGLIDMGISLQGAGDSFLLTISNLSTNGDLGNLTDLSLLNVNISGTNASDFSVAAFSPQVLTTSGTYGLTITLLNTALAGLKSATLTIDTDQGAAFGGVGQSFSYDLEADVQYLPPSPPTVPEPSTMAICGGLGLLGFAMSRRRKS
jgi:hypothetical protein